MTTSPLRDLASRYNNDEMRVPEWTLGDRMDKALRLAGVGVADMAEAFGVSRATVSRWLSDRSTPSNAVLMIWAAGCGVDQEWLETGVPSVEASKVAAVRALEETRQEMTKAGAPKDAGQSVHPLGLEPRTRWFSVFQGGLTDSVNERLTADRRPRHLWAVA